MEKKLEDIYQRLQKPLAECIRQLPPILGNEVVNFAHSNFDTQSFEGKPWQRERTLSNGENQMMRAGLF